MKLKLFASSTVQLTAWSILAVFSQLALVRMFSTIVGATTYYGNFFLLISIFSLAAGFFSRKLDKYFLLIPYFLLVNLLTAMWLGKFIIFNAIAGEYFWLNVAPRYTAGPEFDLQLAIMILCFVSIPLLVLVGARQGEAFIKQEKAHRAYIWMAGGGIAGAVLFTLQNQLRPELICLLLLWALLISACSWSVLRGHFQKSLFLLPILALLLVGYGYSSTSLWSPYQRINIFATREGEALPPNGYGVHSNDSFITYISAVPYQGQNTWARMALGLASSRKRVLVMGSGGGTEDVREVLNAGAEHIVAVEIEPVFIALGRKFDPDKTYDNPRVTVVNTDGRKYLVQNRMKFDCIYYPFVDSQTLASNRARFRLDSFLYTVEGMRLAYDSLAPEGTFLIHFMTSTPWLRQRMYELLKEAIGREVTVFRLSEWHTLYCVRNGATPLSSPPDQNVTQAFQDLPSLPVPSDDWPFFYSPQKSIPLEHVRLLIIGLLILLSLLLILTYHSPSPVIGYRNLVLLLYAFFSGAAFFFIELRTISALTPILGSTYLSQASVVIGIIVASLLGALLGSSRRGTPLYVAWLALLFGLVIAFYAKTWFHPFSRTMVRSTSLYLFGLLLPVFFAGYLYLLYLKICSPETALSMQKWNLIGGVVGGFSECAIVVIGFDKTFWIAALFYCCSGLPFIVEKFLSSPVFRSISGLTKKAPQA